MIKIYTPPHTLFAATHLVYQLRRLGKESVIVDEIDIHDKSIYIIYNAAALTKLPPNYIVMQTEISTSHWFTTHYIKTLRNALAVWDYSLVNVSAYSKENKRTFIVTPGIHTRARKEKDIDFLFYGWLSGSERREKMVNELSKYIKLEVVTNTLKEEMWSLLDRSKVVINIHYFDNSPLELYRLNESLSCGCHVVSEGFDSNYSGIVEFKKSIMSIAGTAINKSKEVFNYDLSGLDNINQLKKAIFSTGVF